ncbi:MAG: methyltransferase, partial [Chitinophagaceae bacterium]
ISQELGSLFKRITADEIEAVKILDIGTGTGLLTLLLAQKNKCLIDGIEIDNDAFQQASENVAASPWAGRIKIIAGDATEFVFPGKYDLIISNPPFYERDLRGNEPKKNLAHHNEGLLLPELLNIIKKNLKPDGIFYLLLPYKRNEEIKKLLIEKELFVQQLTFIRQTVNHDYFRIILSGKLKTATQTETRIDEISIKDGNDQYTPAFVSLLKDFYLHL